MATEKNNSEPSKKPAVGLEVRHKLEEATEIDMPEQNKLEYCVTIGNVGRLFAHQQWRVRRIGATTGCDIHVEVLSDAENAHTEAAESQQGQPEQTVGAEADGAGKEKKRKMYQYHKLDNSREHRVKVVFEAEDAEVRRQVPSFLLRPVSNRARSKSDRQTFCLLEPATILSDLLLVCVGQERLCDGARAGPDA